LREPGKGSIHRMDSSLGKVRISKGALSYIRLLLWWGAQAARTVFTVKEPPARVVRCSRMEWVFPLAVWALREDRSFCIFSKRGEPEVSIRACSAWERDGMPYKRPESGGFHWNSSSREHEDTI
jgi:hypothetical protein